MLTSSWRRQAIAEKIEFEEMKKDSGVYAAFDAYEGDETPEQDLFRRKH
ncbi:MAG TPA: hypothetical protein P5511_03390 [Candidatus Goldiibacteriota bacterium]|nr:hypothetical protein [Candidatus Goldiibacteriota bacterium]